jgi:decaprenylphospho-beta-D-erythro-pentofuranosid-2-ulose 2-reductase
MPENVVVVGATSGIARAINTELARRGCSLVLAGRNMEELQRCADDLRVRFQVPVSIERFDAENLDDYHAFWARCVAQSEGGIDGVVVCHGFLADQEEAQKSMLLLRKSIEINFLSPAALLEIAAAYFIDRRKGHIAAISSVAGDRGRQSNYIYGAAKAGFSAYLQGLRNRLHPFGIGVLTIKPGFVATRMTEGRVNPNSPLMAKPETVARHIDRAIRRRKNVLYTPPIWRVVMAVVRALPEPIFKRLKL